MRRSRVLLRVCALGLGVATALAPMTVAAATTATGVNAGSAFCKQLISQESVSSKYESKVESAEQANNFSEARSAIQAEFNLATQDLNKALSDRGIPGPVQSSLKFFLSVYNKERSAIAKAGSITALETALTSITKVPKFTADSKTIGTYVSMQCGPLTTTSTT
jgi:hypothetical protein